MLVTLIDLLKKIFTPSEETTATVRTVNVEKRVNPEAESHMYDGANTLGNSTQHVPFGSDPGFAPYIPEVDDVMAVVPRISLVEDGFDPMEDVMEEVDVDIGFDWGDSTHVTAQCLSSDLVIDGENLQRSLFVMFIKKPMKRPLYIRRQILVLKI